MKRISLEVHLRHLDPPTSPSIHEHTNKMQNFQQDILHVGKEISSEDMAIKLLNQVISDSHFSAFYSSLITSRRLSTITWEELVPMILDPEEQFLKPSARASKH